MMFYTFKERIRLTPNSFSFIISTFPSETINKDESSVLLNLIN